MRASRIVPAILCTGMCWLLAPALGGGSEPASSATARGAIPEVPALGTLVRAGLLPPMNDRLPEHPMVVPVVERLGDYGGTWRTFHIGADLLFRRLEINYFPLVRWDPSAGKITPGLAESWQYLDDGRTFEFRLRKGLKWSDGASFTTADIRFWWDLVNDSRVIYKPPEWAYRDGQLMQVEVIDEVTARFRYTKPFFFVDLYLATGFWTPELMILPSHYLKQFHPDYNHAYKDFNEFVRKNNVFNNPHRPTVAPWRLTRYQLTGELATFERNPYYYAVDPAGRQLPYIDRIESVRVRDSEAGALMILAGDIDAQFRGVEQRDFGLLRRFADKAGYRILRYEEGTAAWYSVCINWSPEHPDKRELFRRIEFRRGLSLAIDREKLRQVAWNGLGRPQAGAITDEAWHFRSPRGQSVLQRWISEWSQYDPERAATFLDQCGLESRDAQGYREYKGKPLSIVLESWDDNLAAEEANLIAEDFRAVNVRTLVKRASGADLWPRVQLGKFDMYMQHNSEMDLFSFPAWVFPTSNIDWHPAIGRWYMTGGKEGEEPTGVMKQLLDLFEQCKNEPDLEKRHELVLDAIHLHFQHGPFFLGTVGRQPDLVVAKNNFRNVPSTGILGPLAICQPGSLFPEQFFLEQGQVPGGRGQ